MTPEDRCRRIRLILSDVDGVLTDGGLWFDNAGIESKQFHIRDGLGIRLWQRAGYPFGLITGRTSQIVQVRAAELGIEIVRQGSEDKLPVLRDVAQQLNIGAEETCYIGDDLPDLGAVRYAGLGVAVADAGGRIAGSGRLRDAHAWWPRRRAGGHRTGPEGPAAMGRHRAEVRRIGGVRLSMTVTALIGFLRIVAAFARTRVPEDRTLASAATFGRGLLPWFEAITRPAAEGVNPAAEAAGLLRCRDSGELRSRRIPHAAPSCCCLAFLALTVAGCVVPAGPRSPRGEWECVSTSCESPDQAIQPTTSLPLPKEAAAKP